MCEDLAKIMSNQGVRVEPTTLDKHHSYRFYPYRYYVYRSRDLVIMKNAFLRHEELSKYVSEVEIESLFNYEEVYKTYREFWGDDFQ